MDRRIFGLENEYGVTCTFRGQRRLSPDEVARYLFRRVVSWGRSSNVFLRNGARLYLDVGSHPEYATPECDNVRDLVAHDKAGERILEGLVVDAQRRLAEEGISGDIYLFKNNTDSAGNSYGCHENYLVGRHGEFTRLSDVLIPFLVSRQIICGAGKVLQTPRGAVYCVSQRAEHIWEGVSSATTRSRPIINTRDEPHADAERFRRLHVIVGDSNMSETTTLLKVGATDLVLRMIEAGTVMRDLSLDRKSTRLNSSHTVISYAVFCLIPRPPTPTLFPYTTLFRSHPVPAHHQHPRRAARRRRAVPAAACHRRRLEHERDHHAAQGGRYRPGAAHDRGGHGHARPQPRSEEHTSELQSHSDLVCRLLLDTAPPHTYTLSLHDALPISPGPGPSSTPATSRTPTPSGSGGCMSSSATRT